MDMTLKIESVLSQSTECTPDYVADFINYEVRLHRFDHLHLRYYFEVVEKLLVPYISITSLAKMIIPKGMGYDEWLMTLGHEAMQKRENAAVFGTMIHKEFADTILRRDRVGHNRGYNFDHLDEPTGGYIEGLFGPEKETIFHLMIPLTHRHYANAWRRRFKMNLASLFEWYKDKVLNHIAVEVMIRCPNRNIAMTIDLVHSGMFYGKERGMITDLKSWLWDENDERSTKSKFNTLEFQLEGQKTVWNEQFGNRFPVSHVFNVNPKNWRGEKPTYDWSNKTNNRYSSEVEHAGVIMSSFEYSIGYAKAQGLMDPPSKASTLIGSFEDINEWSSVNHVATF